MEVACRSVGIPRPSSCVESKQSSMLANSFWTGANLKVAARENIFCGPRKASPGAGIFCQVSSSSASPAETPAKGRRVGFEGFVEKKKDRPLKQHRTWNEGQRISADKYVKKSKELERATDEQAESSGEGVIRFSRTRAFPRADSGLDDLAVDEDTFSAPDQGIWRQLENDTTSTHLNCQHFAKCSGCVIDTALDKPPVLQEAEIFFSRLGIEELSFYSGSVWEWRCRAKLAVRGTAENPRIGIYEEGTHSIVDIPDCRAHHPRINEAVALLKAAIKELQVQPYDETTGTGEIRYVQMVVSTYNTALPDAERYANGKVQMSLVWNARSEDSFEANQLKPIADYLWQKGGVKSRNPIIHSVWANFQTTRTNVIFGGRWRHMLGEKDLWERVGGVDICFTPSSFGQANVQAFEALLRRLQKAVKQGSSVVELYAGVGIIGLSLAAQRSCRVVKCVEVNKNARLPFELSLARLPRSLDSKISWHCADASVTPIHWLQGTDVVVVDPPRKGLDSSVIDALCTASLRGQGKSKSPSTNQKAEKRPWILRAQQGVVRNESSVEMEGTQEVWPDTLIYISCGWEAFKMDAAALLSTNAWHLAEASAFNLFPGTDSIEILAIFKRGKMVKGKKKSSMTKAKLAKGKAKKHARQHATISR